MKKIVTLLISGFTLISFNALAGLPVGEWRTHLAYTSITQVAETPNLIFGLSDGALFSVDKTGNDIRTYSKLTGLSDNAIATIAYCKEKKLLFIGYQNTNIDLLTDDGYVINIPDIVNHPMTGNKVINRVYFKDDFAYLSMGFGIVVVNLNKQELPATYYIEKDKVKLPVYGVVITNTEIFASTSSGVYIANKNANLQDSNNWIIMPGTPVGSRIVEYEGALYLMRESTGIYKYDGTNWSLFLSHGGVRDLSVSDGRLLITTPTVIYSYDTSLLEERIFGGLSTAYSTVYSSQNNTYSVASGNEGIVGIKNDERVFSVKPSGPVFNNCNVMFFANVGNKENVLHVLSGGQREYTNTPPGFIMRYDGNSWNNVPLPYVNVIGMAVDPRDSKHFYIGTWSDGMYELRFNDNYDSATEISRFHATAGSVSGLPYTGWIEGAGGGGVNWVCGLTYDSFDNLYFLNIQAFRHIKVITNTGSHKSFNIANIAQKELKTFKITSFKQKWLLGNYGSGKGVLIFNDDNIFEDNAVDVVPQKTIFYTAFNDQDGTLTNFVDYNAIAEDRNGNIWVGTAKGPIVFNNVKNNPDVVYSSNFGCTRIKIPRNDGSGLADYLLADEIVTAIAVDGGNRKWLGTQNSGLYLVSADGLQTIHHFTKENSPLLSNRIMSLVIHPGTGEVFIGTDKGIISYGGEASNPNPDYSNVYVFPNPVRPDYTGLITVTGLVENSNVKITDISGNLVYEGQSQGGQLSWNGKNRAGERVSTGVYLVFAATGDGSQHVVSKIMMIK